MFFTKPEPNSPTFPSPGLTFKTARAVVAQSEALFAPKSASMTPSWGKNPPSSNSPHLTTPFKPSPNSWDLLQDSHVVYLQAQETFVSVSVGFFLLKLVVLKQSSTPKSQVSPLFYLKWSLLRRWSSRTPPPCSLEGNCDRRHQPLEVHLLSWWFWW